MTFKSQTVEKHRRRIPTLSRAFLHDEERGEGVVLKVTSLGFGPG